MSFDTAAAAPIVELRTRVIQLEERSKEDRADLKEVIRRLDVLLWWLIGGLVSIVGFLVALASKAK